MKYDIETPPVVVPEPRVSLSLSVAEFAGLYALNHKHGGGEPAGVRGSIGDGLEAACDALHPDWRGKVMEAAVHSNANDYAYDMVDRVFA